MGKLEKKIIVRIIREYNLFDFVKSRIDNNFYFGIDFFNRLCRWIGTKQGYDFWFERQLELCFILCKYDVKNKDNKARFSSYLCFTSPFDSTKFMEIKKKYKLLYAKIYNKKLS